MVTGTAVQEQINTCLSASLRQREPRGNDVSLLNPGSLPPGIRLLQEGHTS